MTTIHLPDMRRGYRRLLRTMLHGDEVTVRGEPTLEYPGATLTFDNPDGVLLPVGVGRRVNTKLAAVEALSLVGGVSRPDLILRAAPGYARVLVEPSDMHYGAYGPRVRDQLGRVAQLLHRDPTSRQAVVSIWRGAAPNDGVDAQDLWHDGDKPCTLTIQFLVRDNLLWMLVNMRSQDVWLGAGMDMFVFGQLRDTLSKILRVPPGPYVHHVGSLHLYKRDLDAVDKVVRMANSDVIRPYAGDLPRGVVGPLYRDEPSSPAGTQVYARALLEDPIVMSDDMVQARHLNPWYARQLGGLHATQVERPAPAEDQAL